LINQIIFLIALEGLDAMYNLKML